MVVTVVMMSAIAAATVLGMSTVAATAVVGMTTNTAMIVGMSAVVAAVVVGITADTAMIAGAMKKRREGSRHPNLTSDDENYSNDHDESNLDGG